MRLFSSLLLAATLATTAFAQCSNGVKERREIRTLTDSEWNAFVAAVKATMAGPSPTAYDRIVKVHVDNRDTVHNVALFFTWHRYYLREFEKELQKSDPNVMLPYWNWAFDSQAPETSIVFRADRFGGNGQNGGCVTNGAFANWQAAYPTPHCLSRSFDAGDRINSFYSSDIITRTISQSQSYDALRRAIEFAPHGAVHVGIGGDMSIMQSPNDPIFWLHHAYIDKIYARWQQGSASLVSNYGGTNSDGSRATANDALPSYNARVRDVFDTTALCYTYAELPADAGASAAPANASPVAKAQGVKATPTAAVDTVKTTMEVGGPTQVTKTSPTSADRASKQGVSDKPPPPKKPAPTSAPSKDTPKDDVNISVPGYDRSNLVALRIPRPLPVEWLHMNNRINVDQVRDHEQTYAKITDQINAIDGYIPPCSLWMRHDVITQLKGKVSNFHATVHGKYVETTSVNVDVSITQIKETVRKQCGGSVRVEADQYKDKLLSVIGTSLPSSSSASYPFTKPLTHEKIPVKY
jgi:tyrosinase